MSVTVLPGTHFKNPVQRDVIIYKCQVAKDYGHCCKSNSDHLARKWRSCIYYVPSKFSQVNAWLSWPEIENIIICCKVSRQRVPHKDMYMYIYVRCGIVPILYMWQMSGHSGCHNNGHCSDGAKAIETGEEISQIWCWGDHWGSIWSCQDSGCCW